MQVELKATVQYRLTNGRLAPVTLKTNKGLCTCYNPNNCIICINKIWQAIGDYSDIANFSDSIIGVKPNFTIVNTNKVNTRANTNCQIWYRPSYL